MEISGNLPSLKDNILLLIVILLAVLDCLTAVIYHIYQYLLEKNIVIPGGDDKSTIRTAFEKVFDDPDLVRKLRTAAYFFSTITVACAVVYEIRVLPFELNIPLVLLYAAVTSLVLILLESILTGIFIRNPQKTADRLSGIAVILSKLFTPLFLLIGKMIPEPVIAEPEDKEDVENHLRDWVENIPENSLLEKEERKMLRSIVHFSNTMIREIMIPRVEVDALEKDTPLEEAAQLVLQSGHSRLPVYEDEIDRIIGVLYAKDLLRAFVEKKNVTMTDLLRKPLFVPESKDAGDLLNEMRSTGIHMAVVVDEYGGTSGVVSMEDIVEEIVGEIRDEYDDQEEQLVQVTGPDEYSFLGRIDVEDINEYLGTHLTRDAADTLAGYLYSQIGKIPALKEKVETEGWIFEIEELSGKQIRRVKAYRAPDEAEKKEEKDVSQ